MKRSSLISWLIVLLGIGLILPQRTLGQADIETPIAVGDTVELGLDANGNSRGTFVLAAEPGQTVTLRWERTSGDYILQTSPLFEDDQGNTIKPSLILQHDNAILGVYTLSDAAPYHMTWFGNSQDVGFKLTVLDGDVIERLEQPTMHIGDIVQVASPAKDTQMIVIPLDLPPDQTLLLQSTELSDSLADPTVSPAVLRDANGELVEPETSMADLNGGTTFITDGALPYTLEFSALFDHSSYSVELKSFFQDKGSIEFDKPITVETLDNITYTYLLETVKEGDFITVSTETTLDQSVAISIFDADGKALDAPTFGTHYEIGNTSYDIAAVPLEGPAPYTFWVYNNQNVTGSNPITFLAASGNTLKQDEMAVLKPGESTTGVIPIGDGTLHFIRLDVKLDSIITIDWTPKDGSLFGLTDGQARKLDPINENADSMGSATFDLSGHEGPFIVPLVASRYFAAGKQFTLTLADGDQALPFDQATLVASTTSSIPATSDTSTTSTSACIVRANNSVNQRSGPGTTFDRAGVLTAGTKGVVDGQAIGTDGLVWWQLGKGKWVRSDLVQAIGDCAAVPVLEM